MRTREGSLGLLSVALLVLLLAGCGGGADQSANTGTPAEPSEPVAGGGGTIEPPEEEELDIEPTGMSLGDNLLDPSIAADNLLPPRAFGAWTGLELVSGQNKTPIDSASIAAGGSTLAISKVGGNVQWTAGGSVLSAYDPADHGNDCYLMSSNLSGFFASGNSVTYTTSDGSHTATLGPNVSIRLTISTSATCP